MNEKETKEKIGAMLIIFFVLLCFLGGVFIGEKYSSANRILNISEYCQFNYCFNSSSCATIGKTTLCDYEERFLK